LQAIHEDKEPPIVIITDGTSIKFAMAATPPDDTIPKITITKPNTRPINEPRSKALTTLFM
jgi:hypothetical protein